MALFSKGFGIGDEGGLLSTLTGGNPNAWLGYLAGALQGGTLGESIGRGIGGFAAGSQADATARGQRSAMQYIAQDPNTPPELKAAILKGGGPMAMKYFENFMKPAELKEVDGNLLRVGPDGRFTVLGNAGPKVVTHKADENIYEQPRTFGGQPSPQVPGAAPASPGAPQVPGLKLVREGAPKPDDVAGLRREAVGIPSIKRFQEAAPIFNSMVKSFGSNSRASDLDFVYGMAKIFDPESVVREGEMIIVNKAQSLPDSIVGAIKRINGGEALQPQTRYDLLKVSKTRMGEYETQARADSERYGGIAQRNKMNPLDVVPSLTPLGQTPNPPQAAPARPLLPSPVSPAGAATFDQRFRGANPGQGLPPPDVRVGPKPVTKDQGRPSLPPPQVGEIRAGYRFLGGNPWEQSSWQKVP